MGFKEKIAGFMQKVSPPVVENTYTMGSRNVIGFYSPFANSGVTNLCVNVANKLHTAKQPVAILDFDLRSPAVYRYFMDDFPDASSIVRKFKNPMIGIREFMVEHGPSGIYIASADLMSSPMDYCDIDIEVVGSIISELKSLFSYILIDLGQDVNYESTLKAMFLSDIIYTCVRPVSHQVETVSVLNEVLSQVGYLNKLSTIVQTFTRNDELKESEFEELKLHLYGNINDSDEIKLCADNYEFLDKPQTIEGKAYAVLIDKIVGDIRKEVMPNDDNSEVVEGAPKENPA